MPRTKKIIKKTTAKKIIRKKAEIKEEKVKPKGPNYFEAIGRRKTSTARVRIFPDKERGILINGKTLENYFLTSETRETVLSPLKIMDCLDNFKVSVRVKGGGVNSQAEAIRYGISRALTLFNPEFRQKLKPIGLLTRDSRMRERKKFGLKRARKAPQWQKR
jgi:small subunit ribosomal protein S9